MCFSKSVEGLYSFSLKGLQTALRKSGYSFGVLDSVFTPGGGSFVSAGYSWIERDRWGDIVGTKEVKVVLRRDKEGLCLEVQTPSGTPLGETYRLVKRESNLKPGTFRYYILDPFSPEESLCEKLYYLPGVGEFVPRSILQSHKVLYKQQRKGHTARYYYSPRNIPKTKYRKTHYRGKITPFWEKYQRLQEEEETRYIEFVVGNGYTSGLCPPDVEREIILDYCRHSGRKTIPRGSLYPNRRRVSGLRRKLR